MARLTIYEIADKAGVSPSTVSRVLNNYTYVQKDTRAKVLKVLADNNYILSGAGKSLFVPTSRIVGVLIADLRTTHHTEGVYFIEHEFSKRGYSCLIYNTGTDPVQHEQYIKNLSQKQVEAVVLMGSVYQNTSVQNAIMVNLPHVPVAICNGYLDGPNIYGVISDERGGVSDAIKLLAKKKKRRKFVFVANHFTPSNQSKLDGFNDGLKLYVDNYISLVVEAGDSILEIEESVRSLMLSNPDIDAIVFSEDFVALVGIHILNEMKIRIPEDVAVVGINNSRYSQISTPSLTSVDNMLYDTSLIAVRNLLEVLRGEPVNHRISISSKVIERDST